MIATCRRCKRGYDRYRRDFPPRGYCSLMCHAARHEKPSNAPRQPQAVTLAMHAHRLTVHGTTSLLDWYGNCEECDRLDGEYAASLEWYTGRAVV